MIGYLRGEILENSDGKILVGIGGSSGGPALPISDPPQNSARSLVGYVVAVPQCGSYSAWLLGQVVELFIHTHIREDAFDLYGFQTRFEKDLFLTLLSVNGIGPKSALGILSSADCTQLVEAIVNEDQAFLTRLPGIGKKTAERVVVELKDNVRKKVEAGVFSLQLTQSAFGKNRASSALSAEAGFPLLESLVWKDAKGALLGLGYREQDVQTVLKQAWENQNPRPERAEDLIRTALRYLV